MSLRWSLLLKPVRTLLALVLASTLLPASSLASDLHDADVYVENGIYHIWVAAKLQVPAEYVRDVLTDYAHVYRLNASIVESEVLHSPVDDSTLIRNRVLLCASVFCLEVERVDLIRTLASGDLQAVIVPELSEFRSGKSVWKITPQGESTYLVYEAQIEPDFYIPPVVGTHIVARQLRNEFTTTFNRIEHIARINSERDWDTDFSVTRLALKETPKPCDDNVSAQLK